MCLSERDRVDLERRVRSQTAPARMAERARIVLLSADGLARGDAPLRRSAPGRQGMQMNDGCAHPVE